MLLPSELLIIIRQLQCIHAYKTRERNWPFCGRTQKGVKPKACIINTEARHIATITVLKLQLINKYDNAKKKFRIWRVLKEQSSFRYDPDTQCITAPDHVWEAYLEVS